MSVWITNSLKSLAKKRDKKYKYVDERKLQHTMLSGSRKRKNSKSNEYKMVSCHILKTIGPIPAVLTILQT